MTKSNGKLEQLGTETLPVDEPRLKPKKGGFGKKSTADSTAIEIPKPDIRALRVRIIGDTPLICHKFSEKAQKMIEDKQQQKASKARGAREPKKEYEGARHRMPDGSDGFPAGGVKMALVSACTFVDGMTKVLSKGAFFIIGDQGTNLIKINYVGKAPRMVSDYVRINNGRSGDVRYRPYYDEWWMDLCIRYNALVVSSQQIVNLLANAGFSIGIGDWRPSAPMKPGTNGMFSVASEQQAKAKNPFSSK